MSIENFTPWASLGGGVLIGIAAIALLLFFGRIAGVSGILGGLLQPQRGDTLWRVVFVLGMLTGAVLLRWLHPPAMAVAMPVSTPWIILGGLLVGFGTRLGSGCTSGHGVCGIGRLAPRSIVGSVIFLITALISANLVFFYQCGGG